MRRTVDPRFYHPLRGRKINGQIFTQDFVGRIAGIDDSPPDIIPVRVDMREIVAVEHILRFFRRGAEKTLVYDQGAKIAGRALAVDKRHKCG